MVANCDIGGGIDSDVSGGGGGVDSGNGGGGGPTELG